MTRYQHWSLPSSNLDVSLPSRNESKPRSILCPLQDKALDLFFVRYRKKDYPMVLIAYINIWDGVLICGTVGVTSDYSLTSAL